MLWSIQIKSFKELYSCLVNKVRLVTLQMSIILLKQLVYNGHPGEPVLKDVHLAFLEVSLQKLDYEKLK